jgi:hypothetical protein
MQKPIRPIRTIVVVALAIALQILSWSIRTYAYNRCCAPPPENDPYADVRATSYPGLLIASSVVMSLWLNGLVIGAFLYIAKTRTAMLLLHRVAIAIVGGSCSICLPLAVLSLLRNETLPTTLYGLFVFAPTSYAAIIGVGSVGLRRLRRTST